MSAKLEIQAGPNMNLSPVLYTNIIQSPYFKFTLKEKVSFPAVLNEIINQVVSLEPFLRENVASTAFCLLYKLHTLKLTVKQVTSMIGNKDSPHVRALAFLYLRYAGKPADLWEWFEPHLEDSQEFQVTKNSKTTLGQFIRSLLKDQKYQGTMLPRIPVPIARSIEAKFNEKYPPSSSKVIQKQDETENRRQKSLSPKGRSSRDGSRGREKRYRSRSPRGRSRSRNRRHSSPSSSRERNYRRQMESSHEDRRRRSRSRSRHRRDRSRSRSRHRRSRS